MNSSIDDSSLCFTPLQKMTGLLVSFCWLRISFRMLLEALSTTLWARIRFPSSDASVTSLKFRSSNISVRRSFEKFWNSFCSRAKDILSDIFVRDPKDDWPNFPWMGKFYFQSIVKRMSKSQDQSSYYKVSFKWDCFSIFIFILDRWWENLWWESIHDSLLYNHY